MVARRAGELKMRNVFASAAIALMLVGSAHAAEVTMTCVANGFEDNPSKAYVVHFNKQARTLYLTRDGVTRYHVTSVEDAPLIVSGSTVAGGPQFKAYFKNKVMEYEIPGAPAQQDQCK
jgi:hypothetical protein